MWSVDGYSARFRTGLVGRGAKRLSLVATDGCAVHTRRNLKCRRCCRCEPLSNPSSQSPASTGALTSMDTRSTAFPARRDRGLLGLVKDNGLSCVNGYQHIPS
jgi:hypothetical protein